MGLAHWQQIYNTSSANTPAENLYCSCTVLKYYCASVNSIRLQWRIQGEKAAIPSSPMTGCILEQVKSLHKIHYFCIKFWKNFLESGHRTWVPLQTTSLTFNPPIPKFWIRHCQTRPTQTYLHWQELSNTSINESIINLLKFIHSFLSCVSGQLSLLPSMGWKMSSSLQATEWRPSIADWGSGISACCKPRVQLFIYAGKGWPHSVLQYHQLMLISCHFRDCKALLGYCKKCYNKCQTLLSQGERNT